MSIEICSLIPVDLRLAWAHEANDFTPWLASNLDRLRAAVGIDLVLEGTEVTVGPFSADILATDALTNERVLIENQLEQADHAHLGQILTYLAGLDARSVIWIAKAFRDEHLSAVRWLNNNTMDDFSFFAVEVSAVRIGDSPVAPLFSVVENLMTGTGNSIKLLLAYKKISLRASRKSTGKRHFLLIQSCREWVELVQGAQMSGLKFQIHTSSCHLLIAYLLLVGS